MLRKVCLVILFVQTLFIWRYISSEEERVSTVVKSLKDLQELLSEEGIYWNSEGFMSGSYERPEEVNREKVTISQLSDLVRWCQKLIFSQNSELAFLQRRLSAIDREMFFRGEFFQEENECVCREKEARSECR